MIGGIPQCVAEMIAAREFNQAKGNDVPIIYGVVTTGNLWQFLKLVGNEAFVDTVEYPI